MSRMKNDNLEIMITKLCLLMSILIIIFSKADN